MMTYFSVTTTISARRSPKWHPMLSSSSGTPGVEHPFIVYSGLVPISPQTTPRAPWREQAEATESFEFILFLPALPMCRL